VLLYWSGDAAGGVNEMVWFDRSGKMLGTVDTPNRGLVLTPAISPDEKTVAFTSTVRGGGADISLRDLVRGTDLRFTARGQNTSPVWSPKGDRIAFVSRTATEFAMFQKATSGVGEAEQLVPIVRGGATGGGTNQWSRDGRFIVFTNEDPKNKLDVWVLPIEERERKPIPFLQTAFNEFQGQLSPDSRWMSYTSDETGKREVYVRAFPSGEGKLKISTAGGDQPRWRADGKEIFFLAADRKMNVVAVKSGPGSAFEAGLPEPLFDSHVSSPTTELTVLQYDVTMDGKRFLVVTTGLVGSSSPPLTAVVNWKPGR
jgi:dipeptidyl aminopeptidase/acylaminoacyl peptidase